MGKEIKSFSKSSVKLPLPFLLEVQKQAWQNFWKRDLLELFFEVSPIRDYTKEELELWFSDFKLDPPRYESDLEAKQNNDSYERSLRVKAKLVNLKTKEVKEQEIFLCDFPIMTERGTFIVNGVERVAISQLIRSPGAFFTVQNTGGKNNFGAKIIPNRGAWLEFATESSGFIGVKIDRKRKVAATTLLRAFGVGKTEDIKKLFRDVDNDAEIKYIEETLSKDLSSNQEEAWIEVYKRLRPGEMIMPESAGEFLKNMFFNFERYDLSKVGRWKTWQRLPELMEGFKKYGIADLVKVQEISGKAEKKILSEQKKANESGNKEREITIGNRILHAEDIIAVIREIIRLNNTPGAKPDQIDHLGNRRIRCLNEFLQNRMRVGLMRMERIVKDRMSTLDIFTLTPNQLINPKPVMAVVREFFSSSQLSQFMDNENPLAELEHKRRLTATGPGGLTRERAGFEVRDVQPSHYGRICPIQTPEGPNIGLVGHLAGFSKVNSYGFLETPYFKVKNGKVLNEIKYLNAYEEENHSIAAGGIATDEKDNIIPNKIEARVNGEAKIVSKKEIDFIDCSPEQCISVATSLIPFLRNDDANRALMGSNMQRQSVPLIKPQAPLVCTGVEEKIARDSGQVIIAEEDGVVTEIDAKSIIIKGKSKKIYNLRTFIRTNQYTCFHQKPIVDKRQKIKKGQVIADGGSIEKGRLALGRNFLVAFMPWRGGNYEDSIVISEKLVKNDAFSSINIEDFTCDVRETKLGPEVTTSDIPNVGEEKLKDLDEEGIVRIGAEVGPGDILVGKISPKGEAEPTAEERLLRAIFGEKAKEVKDTSLTVEHGKVGRVTNVKVFERSQGHKLDPGVIKRVKIEIAQLRKIMAGDKLSGRHGNKGVISRILPEEEMPFLEDGTPVDLVLNPLGVASRMNIGQILETHLGWAAKKLGYIAETPALSGANEDDIKRELRKAGLPENGKTILYDGRTGIPFSQEITVGYIYMMKLVHMVEDKIHMRSIGPYSLITQQPLGGKAQFGGQRLGEMEVWALEGYGAAHSLQEMITIKSDDVLGRAATYNAILKGEKIENPNTPASFNLLINELKSLGLDIVVKTDFQKPRESEKGEDKK